MALRTVHHALFFVMDEFVSAGSAEPASFIPVVEMKAGDKSETLLLRLHTAENGNVLICKVCKFFCLIIEKQEISLFVNGKKINTGTGRKVLAARERFPGGEGEKPVSYGAKDFPAAEGENEISVLRLCVGVFVVIAMKIKVLNHVDYLRM